MTLTEQKLIVLQPYNGQYGNFFYTTGSHNSLQSYLDEGWLVKYLQADDKESRGWVLLERIQRIR